jgi:hypothetical protein
MQRGPKPSVGTHARPLPQPVSRLRSLFGSARTHQFIEFANRFLTGSPTRVDKYATTAHDYASLTHVKAALEQRTTGKT